MQEEINLIKEKLYKLETEYYRDNFSVSQSINKETTFRNNVGFFAKAPVAQQAVVTTPSGGGGSSGDAVDITARTAIGQIKTALQNLGLTL